MNKILFLSILISFSSASFAAEKVLTCADATCEPNFPVEDQRERVYYTSVDAGTQNEDDIKVETNNFQSPRSLRLYVENNNKDTPVNMEVNLVSKVDDFNSGDAFLIVDYLNNLNVNLNGFSGAVGKSASVSCSENYQSGKYGQLARAEYQAKRIVDNSLPTNRCVYADIDFLQRNNFECGDDGFNEISNENPSVNVQRLRGKTKCLGVGFQDVCLSRTLEVTCTWKLKYLEPANLAGQFSSNPNEQEVKKFLISEEEFLLKKRKGLSEYLCNTVTRGVAEPAPIEMVLNGNLEKNVDNWYLLNNKTQWINRKVKFWNGPDVVAVSGFGRALLYGNVTAPIVFTIRGYSTSTLPETLTTEWTYQDPRLSCSYNNVNRQYSCTYSVPSGESNTTTRYDKVVARIKIKDRLGQENIFAVKLNYLVYNQTLQSRQVTGRGTWCRSTTQSLSYTEGLVFGGNGGASGGSYYGSYVVNNIDAAIKRTYPQFSVTSWARTSGDLRRGCGGQYIYFGRAVGRYFDGTYSLVRETADTELSQVYPTEIGKKYRFTGIYSAPTEETSVSSIKVDFINNLTGVSYFNKIAPAIATGDDALDFTFTANAPQTKMKISMVFTNTAGKSSSVYVDNVSLKPVSLNAGPSIPPTSPITANVAGALGNGYYALFGEPTTLRTAPGFDSSNFSLVEGSNWDIKYTGLGQSCPLFYSKIATNYLASHVEYDPNDDQCDDLNLAQDPTATFIQFQNIGFERNVQFGTETLSCSLTSCPVNFLLQNVDKSLDVINTSDGIDGTAQGSGVIVSYDFKNLSASANPGTPGSPGPNDIPTLENLRVCAKIQDFNTTGQDSEFAKNPMVQFKRYNWKALNVIEGSASGRNPTPNGKKINIFRKIDSSVRHLLKNEVF